MPLTLFLKDERFDRETVRVMALAFEMARIAVGFAHRRDLPDETIAKKIIELAKMGETNPNRLCEKALVDFRRERS
jgi:hypothetical protein